MPTALRGGGRTTSRWLAAVLIVAAAFFATPVASAAAAGPTVRDLGPASSVTSTSTAERIGDHIYTATSGVSPVQVGAYNIATHTIDWTVPLPSGAGAWGMTAIGTDLYLGTYTPGDLYRLDTTTRTLTKVANFGSFIWALAASPDGKVFAGTYPDAGVFSYDPATGATRAYGTVVAGEQYVRSIAVDETRIYAGVGTKAHLMVVDRDSGAKTEVLPAQYADRTFVATLDLSGKRLAASLSPTGTMLIYDTDDLANPVEVQAPGGDQYITAITVDDATGDTYFGTRPSGTFYRHVAATGALERLGSPYDGAYFNRIFLDGGTIKAELTSSVVEFDTASGQFTGYDLVAAGLPPAPEQAMQIAAVKDKVLVSGKAGIQVHDLAAGTSSRVFLPGEAKTMTPVGNQVYLGVYTLARLWSMRPDGTALTELTRIENEQTRPTDAVYDERGNRLLMSTQPDYGRYNGTLTVFDLASGDLAVHRGVVPDQSVASVVVSGDVAFLGSEIRNSLGTDPIVKTATVSAFDLRTNQVRWQVTPVAGAARITDLAEHRGRLYGVTDTGKLFVMDPASGAVTSVTTIGTSQSTLVTARDGLYGSDGKRVFQVLPARDGAAPQVRTVVDGLSSDGYGVVMIAAAPDGSALYTIKGRNLIRVTGLPRD